MNTVAIALHNVTRITSEITHFCKGPQIAFHFDTKKISVYTDGEEEIPTLKITLYTRDLALFVEQVSENQPVDSEPQVG